MKRTVFIVLCLAALNLQAQTMFNYNVPCGSDRYYNHKNKTMKIHIVDSLISVSVIDNTSKTERFFSGFTNNDMHIALTEYADSLTSASLKYTKNGSIEYYEGQQDFEKYTEIPITEMYPIDYVSYEAKRYILVNEQKDSISLYKKHVYPIPAKNLPNDIQEKITKIFLSSYSIAPSNINYPEDIAKNSDILAIQNYISIFETNDIEEELIYIGNWSYEECLSVILNKNNMLSFSRFEFSYEGGAHGVHNYSYYNYDLDSCKKIELNDIFNDGFEKAIQKKINKYIINQFKDYLSEEQKSLSDIGFFVDPVFLTDNFLLKENSIIFTYNIYEIAPYSFGAIDVEIPYTELKDYIRKDGVATKLTK